MEVTMKHEELNPGGAPAPVEGHDTAGYWCYSGAQGGVVLSMPQAGFTVNPSLAGAAQPDRRLVSHGSKLGAVMDG
jgi:hypothetical protein